MRIVCHAQHLTGVGHYVRMHLIAAGLAAHHEVHLVDGGRPVPTASRTPGLHPLSVPRVGRDVDGRILDLEGGASDSVLDRRASTLAAHTHAIAPHAVLIDHYPFSKWELDGEIAAMVSAARDVNPSVVVLCSLRDIAPPTRYEPREAGQYATRVVEMLTQMFDGILVHADPSFTRLDDHFARADAIPIPIEYTGFVTGPTRPSASPVSPGAVLSAGGLDATGFMVAAVRAFLAHDRSELPLDVFLPPGADDTVQRAVRAEARGAPVTVHDFSPQFGEHLGAAALSISRCGYNTAAALLRTGTPAVVVPDPRLSDQELRAQLLAAHGVASMVPSAHQLDEDALAAAIGAALETPPRPHTFDLDGVEATRAFVERFGASAAR